MKFKREMMAAAALCVPLAAGGAHAQEAQDQRLALEEVVVTAQRVEQNLQKVPIAVSAATAETVERMGVTSTYDLSVIAPAITITSGIGGATSTIRGIGGTGSASDEPANAFYVDGVYLSSATNLVISFNNIERIEVLKGPQGTLFGRNATGGVVNITTRTPSHDLAVKASMGYDNYETVEGNFYVSGGLTDTLAMDLAFYGFNQDQGWGKNVRTGQDAYTGSAYAVRSKLLWEPTDATSVTATAMYTYSNPQVGSGSQIVEGFRNPIGQGNVGFYNINQDFITNITAKQRAYSLKVQHDFSWARLINLTSFDHTQNRQFYDQDATPNRIGHTDQSTLHRTKTNELQLQSLPSSEISWVVGAFYMDKSQKVASSFTGTGAPGGFQLLFAEAPNKSFALFGQTTFPLTSRTNGTVGLRYTMDERGYEAVRTTGTVPTTRFMPDDIKDKKLTWRFAVDHEFMDDISGYASVSRGYKGGIFNIPTPGTPPVEPQIVDAYEVGLKTELFDRRVRFNTAVFNNEFKNIQVRALAANGTTTLLNAARARIRGVDVDFVAVLTENLTINGGVSYLDGKYTDFPNAPAFTPRPAPGGGLIGSFRSATGNRTTNTPEWVFTLAAQYVIPTDAGDFELAASWNYNDGYFWEASNFVPQPSYHLVNASIQWKTPSEDFGVRLWARNLLDEKYFSNLLITGQGPDYFPATPRTVGITLSYEY